MMAFPAVASELERPRAAEVVQGNGHSSTLAERVHARRVQREAPAARGGASALHGTSKAPERHYHDGGGQ